MMSSNEKRDLVLLSLSIFDTVKELYDILGGIMSRSTINKYVTSLIDDGLIEYTICDDDGRTKKLSYTKKSGDYRNDIYSKNVYGAEFAGIIMDEAILRRTKEALLDKARDVILNDDGATYNDMLILAELNWIREKLRFLKGE